MKINSLFKKSEDTIAGSIALYRKPLMEDINLTLRLTYNNTTYLTKPTDWTENDIVFEAPMTGLDYVILPQDTIISVILVSRFALFETKFHVVNKYRKNSTLYYIAKIISPLVKRQQRADFRLEVILDTHYQLFFNHPNSTTDIAKGNGTCLNISVGGMCLNCTHQFHTKDLLKLDFNLLETPLSIIGEVLYLGEQTDSGSYTHRIRFIDVDNPKSNLLRQLIFKKQSLQLRYQSP